jgi:hypothetical protein
VLFGAVVATNLEHAILLEKKLGELTNTIADIEPPPDMLENFIEANQIKKLPLVRAIKQEVSPLQFAAPDTQPVDINALSRTLYSLKGYCGAALDDPGVSSDPELTRQFVSLRQAIEDLRKAMLAGDASALAGHADKLAEFQRALFADVRGTFESLQNQNVTGPLRVEDLPAALRDQFIGESGKFLLQVYPKADVWERTNQEAFVADLRTVDPDVTGTPVQLLEYETLLKNSYVVFARGDCVAGFFSLPQPRRGHSGTAARRHRHALAGWLDGVVWRLVQSGQHHDAAAGDWHWRDQRDSNSQPLRRGTDAEHSGAQHRKGRARVGVDGHRRFRQSSSRQRSGHSQFGLCDGRGHYGMHDCGFDFSAGLAESAGPLASFNKTTQCRQNLADTGSGGTEVKTSIVLKSYRKSGESQYEC